MRNLMLFLLFTSAFLGAALATPTPNKCTEEEFHCGDTTSGTDCIPLEWACDNVNDCIHGRDEALCHYLHICPSGDYMCRNGECVSAASKCNGIDDCSDSSDEAFCDLHTTSATTDLATSLPAEDHSLIDGGCTPDEFLCEKSKKCIDKSFVCDHRADCIFMEDEADCEKNCTNTDLKCNDGSTCYVRCDSFVDCADGSDEEGCEGDKLPSIEDYFLDHFQGCNKDEFQCSNHVCIPKDKLCDKTNDCSDGEDEGGMCGSCPEYECAYGCKESSKGPECYCSEGSFLTADLKSCEADKQFEMSTDSSSSTWGTFCVLLLLMIAIAVVIVYFILRNYPEFIDRVQYRAVFSSRAPTTFKNVNVAVAEHEGTT